METSASYEARSAPSSYPTGPFRRNQDQGFTGCGKTLDSGVVSLLERIFWGSELFFAVVCSLCFASGSHLTGLQTHFGPIGPAIQSESDSSYGPGFAP